MEKISIIIPVYNSALSLPVLNDEIDCFFKTKDYAIEKIFVDDVSKDDSLTVLHRIEKEDRRNKLHQCTVKVIPLRQNAGQQNALFCGLHYASGDYIVTMDDDLQHNIEYVETMIQRLRLGAELVYGVHPANELDVRSLGSKLTGQFFKRTFPALKGCRVSSFRAFKKETLQDILKCSYPFIYLSALLLQHVEQVENIEIEKRDRCYGTSGYNLKKLVKLYVKLNYYYGDYIPEWLKPTGVAYEEVNDVRCGQLPAKCY